jgi:glyoxylase-like metal-dependent hydrolase (beta-lactamase superfamily II)
MNNPAWKIITIGYLQHNDYWEEQSIQHEQICTSTLIETETRRILVDPGMAPGSFSTFLNQRTGLKPAHIDTIFLTHFHKNHWNGIELFPKSSWMMGKDEIRWWKSHSHLSEKEKTMLARIVPIEEHPIEGIETLSTPGHTHGLTSLMFEAREGMVLVTGDAVLTFDHFDTCEPSANPESAPEARRSIERIAKIADIVVPGHDNFFVV